MLKRSRFLFFVISFLSVGFLFLSLPEKGFPGFAQPGPECCQFEPDQCYDFGEGGDGGEIPACSADDVRPGFCNEETGLCEVSPSAIPTLNEWGLISVVIALGVVGVLGILVYRRRRTAA